MASRFWYGTFLLALAGCRPSGGGEDEPHFPTVEEPRDLTEGRSFELTHHRADGTTGEVRIGDEEDAAILEELESLLAMTCRDEADLRFEGVTSAVRGARLRASIDLRTVLVEQNVQLCLGHRYRLLAETVTPLAVFSDGRVEPPSEDDRTPVVFSVSPQRAHGRATLILLATEAFREAALLGTRLLDPASVPDGLLSQEVAAGAEDGGLSDTDRVPVALVATAATSEAVAQLDESGRQAETEVLAASAERGGRERDLDRARRAEWADPIDSRLSVANLWVGVAEGAFDSPTDVWRGAGDPGDDGEGEFDSCDVPPSPDVSCPMRLMRDLRIDPRLGDGREDEDILADVQATLVAQTPDAYDDRDRALDPSTFVSRHTPCQPSRFSLAATRLVQEAEVMGREILPVPATMRDEMPPVRGERVVTPVLGVRRSVHTTPPVVLSQRTVGTARFDDLSPDARVGEDDPPLVATEAYARRGIVQTMDFVASRLTAAASRADLRQPDDERGGAIRLGSPLAFLSATVDLSRLQSPRRAEVCMGVEEGDQLTRARIRLQGGGDDPSEYELYWGEAGLECGLYASIEGVPCEREDFRVDVAGVARDGAGTSDAGFGGTFLEWLIRPDDVPADFAEGLEVGGRVYLVRRRGSSREAYVGVRLSGGERDGTYSRCMLLPAGPDVGASISRALTPYPDECSAPLDTCAGLPRDLRLPLEDEVLEAATGRDDIESSWVHHLRVAREAAVEADRLGEELIQQGLSMDLRAEAARDELETLCGGVVNVDSLGPIVCDCGGPSECDSSPDCNGGACRNGICSGDSILDRLTDAPDSASIHSCLGGLGGDDLVVATLGDDPQCVFQVDDGTLPPCACRPGDECPICGTGGGDCDEAFPDLPGGYVRFESETLDLTVSEHNGSVTADCRRLAELRTTDPGSDPWGWDQKIGYAVDAQWFSQATFRSVAQAIGYRQDLFHVGHVTLGGSDWLSTGHRSAGPNEAFPCASNLSPEDYDRLCASPGPTGPSLLCGMQCDDQEDRLVANRRLYRAMRAIGALGGESTGAMAPSFMVPPLNNDAGVTCQNSGFLGDGLNVDHLTVPGGSFAFPRRCDTPYTTSNGGVCPCDTALPFDPVLSNPAYPWVGGDTVIANTNQGACVLLPTSGLQEMRQQREVGGALCPTTLDSTFIPDYVDDLPAVGAGRWLPSNDDGVAAFLRDVAEGDIDANDPVSWVKWVRWDSDAYDLFPLSLTDNLATRSEPAEVVMDALEMGCMALNADVGGCDTYLQEVPQISSPADMHQLSGHLRCAANRIEGTLDRMVVVDMPSQIAADIRNEDNNPLYPELRGQYAQTAAQLRAELETMVMATHQVGANLRDFGTDIELAASQLKVEDLQDDLSHIQFMSTKAEELTRCIRDAVEGAYKSVVTFGLSAIQAEITCINSSIQIELAGRAADIEANVNQEE